MKNFLTLYMLIVLLQIIFWIGIIYIGVHFLMKVW